MMKFYLKYILLLFVFVNIIFCGREGDRRKIKLSSQRTENVNGENLTTTIHLEPQNRRSIAVMFFQNKTGDQNLEWLRQGLTEMFIRALSQSSYISVLSTDRLYEIVERLDKSKSGSDFDVDMAGVVAQEADVEAVLLGKITRSGNALKLSVRLHEPKKGLVLQEESIEGPGLEKIFSMVDQLTQKIKSELHLALDAEQLDKGIADLSTNSLEAWRCYMKGLDSRNKMLHLDAAAEFRKAIEHDPNFVSAHIQLIQAYFHRKELEKAYSTFEKLKPLKAEATEEENYQIDLLQARLDRNVQEMIDILKKRVTEFPKDRDARLSLADMYFGLSNYEEAIQHYKKVISLDPNFKLAYNQMGYAFAHLGRYDEAIATLEKYKEIAPDEPNPYDSLGEIYLYLGEYDKAEKYFKEALLVNDRFDASWEHLVNVNMDRGDYKKALSVVQKFEKRASDDLSRASVYYTSGLLRHRLGDKVNAVKELQKGIAYFQSMTFVADYLKELYSQMDDEKSAENILLQSYAQILNRLNSDSQRFGAIGDLALFSFHHNVKMNETIRLLRDAVDKSENEIGRMRTKFFLTLLLIKQNSQTGIETLWDELSSDVFVSAFREMRNLSYSNTWKYHFYLNNYYYSNVSEGISNYEMFIDLLHKNGLQIPEVAYRIFLADLYTYIGNTTKAQYQLQIAGVPHENNWMIIGPFDNKNGFHTNFIDEKNVSLASGAVNRKYKHFEWKKYEDSNRDGYVDLKQFYNSSFWKVGYGLLHLKSTDVKEVQFRFGTDEAVKMWLNDQEIWKINAGRQAIFDNDIVNVTLKKGINKVLVKVCNRAGEWGFYFRVTDSTGHGVSGIEFLSSSDRLYSLNK